MNVSPLKNQVPIDASDVPIERLAGNANLNEQQKVAEGSRQFEAVLLRQILSETQKPVIKSKLTDDSTAAGIYRDMITTQLAESISKSGALGLSKTLEHQLSRQVHSTSPAGHNPAEASPTTASGADVVRPYQSTRSVHPALREVSGHVNPVTPAQ